MIQITPQMRILLAIDPVDFRKGIDGLAAVCRRALGTDPMTGVLVLFRNRRGKALKMIVYDGQGFWMAQKRLSCGRFGWWPRTGEGPSVQVQAHELHLLLWNGDPTRAEAAPMWRGVEPKD